MTHFLKIISYCNRRFSFQSLYANLHRCSFSTIFYIVRFLLIFNKTKRCVHLRKLIPKSTNSLMSRSTIIKVNINDSNTTRRRWKLSILFVHYLIFAMHTFAMHTLKFVLFYMFYEIDNKCLVKLFNGREVVNVLSV